MRIFDLITTLFRFLKVSYMSLDYFTKRAETKIVKRQSHFIITLSTIPSRIELIDPTINSLLDQTILPKYIYISIPKFSIREQCEYKIPDRFLNHPIIKIINSDRDWGPATKSIPAIIKERETNNPLIILDDDYVYHKRMIETYLEHEMEYKDAVLCQRGWNLPKEMLAKNKIRFTGKDIKYFKRVNLIEGSYSYLVRPEFFKDDFFNYDHTPEAAFFCDDIWISGHLNKNKVPIYVMPFDAIIFRIFSFSIRNTIRLADLENAGDQNENIMYKYFEKDWVKIEA